MDSGLLKRGVTECICCGSNDLNKEYGLVTPFFSERVLAQARSQMIDMLQCKKCKTRFFDVDISNHQLSLLYTGYRESSYFEQRNKYEPWYTQAINDGIGSEIEFEARRKTCVEALASAHVKNDFASALDHGGDRGQMLSGDVINAGRKAVYEISGVNTEPDVENVANEEMHNSSWDLVLSCHVLEHLGDPAKYVKDLIGLGHKGTVYFFEIPNEMYKSTFINGTWLQKRWLNWLVSHPLPLKLFHFLSVAFRLKLKILLPFLFPALNEHLNFFSVKGLNALLSAQGLDVKYSGIGSSGHIVAVAIKL